MLLQIGKWILKKLLAMVLFVGIVFMLLYLLIRIPIVQNSAKSFLETTLSDITISSVRIEDITISFPYNFSLNNVQFRQRDSSQTSQPFFSMASCKIKIALPNLLHIVRNEIFDSLKIEKLLIQKPIFNIEKHNDSAISITKNLAKLFSDTSKSLFKNIMLRDIELDKGEIHYKDLHKQSEINLTNLSIASTIQLADTIFHFSFSNISFSSDVLQNIRLQSSFDLIYTPSLIELTIPEIIINNALHVSAKIKAHPPKKLRLDNEGLSNIFFTSDININQFPLHLLQHINSKMKSTIKSTSMIFDAHLSSTGTFNHLNIYSFFLKTDNSILIGSASLRKVLQNISVHNISLFSSQIETKDIKESLIAFGLEKEWSDIQEVDKLSKVYIEGNYKQTEDTPVLNFLLSTSIGKFNYNGTFGIKEKIPFYSGIISLSLLNPHTIFPSAPKNLRINFDGEISGNITTMDNLQAYLSGSMQNCTIFNRLATISTFKANFQNKQCNIETTITSGQNNVAFNGDINFATNTPTYSLNGKIESSELGSLIPNHIFRDQVKCFFEAKGSSFSLDSTQIAATFFKDSLFTKQEFSLLYSTLHNESTFKLTSYYINVDISGKYTIPNLVLFFQNASASLQYELQQYYIYQSDTLKTTRELNENIVDDVDFKFSIDIKKPPVPSAIFNNLLNGNIKTSGDIHVSKKSTTFNLDIDSDSLRFAYVRLFNLNGTLNYDENKILSFDEQTIIHRNRAFSSSFTVNKVDVGTNTFYYTKSNISFADGKLITDIKSMHQGTKSILNLNFDVSQHPSGINLTFHNLEIAFKTFKWSLAGHPSVFITPTTLSFPTNLIFSNGEQNIIVEGELSSVKYSVFKLSSSNIALHDFNDVFLDETKDFLKGTLHVQATFQGILNNLEGNFSYKFSNFQYNRVFLPEFIIMGKYEKNNVNLNFHATNETAEGMSSFKKIEGWASFPFALNYQKIATKPLLIKFECEQVPSPFLTSFIPFIENSTGYLNLNGSITGLVQEPNFSIDIIPTNTTITLLNTNVHLNLNGMIQLKENNILFDKILLTDSLGGRATLNGNIQVANFAISNLNLTSTINKLLVFNQDDNSVNTFYGKLFCSSKRLSLHGSLESPMLDGELSINYGDVTILNSASSSKEISTQNSFIKIIPRYTNSSNQKSIDKINTEVKQIFYENGKIPITENSSNFMNNVEINLAMSSDSLLKFQFVMNKGLGTALSTNIQKVSLGILKAKNGDYLYNGFAEIASGKYNFLSLNLDLKPNGSIVWLSNPMEQGIFQNLIAYKNIKRTNTNTTGTSSTQDEEIEVNIKITNQIKSPKLESGYSIFTQGQSEKKYYKSPGSSLPGIEDQNAEANTIALLLTGQWFPSNQTTSNTSSTTSTNTNTSALNNIMLGTVSSQLSRILNVIPWIRSVNIGTNSISNTDLGLNFSLNIYLPGFDNKLSFFTENSTATNTAQNKSGKNTQKLEYKISEKLFVDGFHTYGSVPGTVNVNNIDYYGLGVSYKENAHTFVGIFENMYNGFKDVLKINDKPNVDSLPPNQKPIIPPRKDSTETTM